MKYEITIIEEDFLNYQLFAASTNPRIQRTKRNSWLGLAILSGIVAMYFYYKEATAVAIYFLVVAIMVLVFYPSFFRWRYKRHYQTYVKEMYGPQSGNLVVFEIKEGYLYTRDFTGESKINLFEVVELNELADYFFLKLSTNYTFIIPKREIHDATDLAETFRTIGLKVNDFKGWKW